MIRVLLLLLISSSAVGQQLGWQLSGDTLFYYDGVNPRIQFNKTGLFTLKTDTRDSLNIIRTSLSEKAAASHAHTIANVTGLQTALDGKQAAGSYLVLADIAGKLNSNGSAASLTSIPVNQATGVLPFANGGITGVAATSATTGTMTVSMTSRIVTITPTGACTFNATGGVQGQTVTFVVTTSGAASFVLTFGTNFKKTGTLATGTTTARVFAVSFLYDGTNWIEISRTAAQT